ncbi:DUF3015 family protein [Salinisphaera aquimarina]|uniref:DUF3015 family protein n=1 Tax=Salinisphaera aquimarina TaxID=2094031 RepID=A0ABV7EK16_9GAMM
MNMSSSTIKRGVALCSVMAIGLSVATISSARDRDDLITTASTAGTTAYIVGKNIDDNDFAQAQDFADTQQVALRREAATGEGENIDSLAALLGEENPQAFGQWMQSHYAELYSNEASAKTNLADRIVAMR